MKNALTVDLEDYFHVSAYAGKVRLEEWDSYPSRVAQNTDRLLELLSLHNCKATFFVLGWVAEKKPEVVARVAAAGHEIACHSLLHRRIFDLSPQEFREDTHRAKAVIEDATGKQVVGYRAPSFSVTKKSSWALEILAKRVSNMIPAFSDRTSFLRDSRRAADSLLDRYPERSNSGVSHGNARHRSMRSPIAGGAYLRLLPYRFTLWSIRHLNEQEHFPVCVYIHPWELDPQQPRMGGSLSARARHYFGLQGTEAKLKKLMRDVEFCL